MWVGSFGWLGRLGYSGGLASYQASISHTFVMSFQARAKNFREYFFCLLLGNAKEMEGSYKMYILISKKNQKGYYFWRNFDRIHLLTEGGRFQ